MNRWDSYALLDFGAGRKLERFGAVYCDRPCPAAEAAVRDQAPLWRLPALRFTRAETGRAEQRGVWRSDGAWPDNHEWLWEIGPLRLWLHPTPFGHLGAFPEQIPNWQWMEDWFARRATSGPVRPTPRVLNLFAYTGGSTLMAAACGASVAHVDAAKNLLSWARRNAEASGLADRPIRWLADDARRFVAREIRREQTYDLVILDPPSFGHGPQQRPWRIDEDLADLLAQAIRLLSRDSGALLLTCHSEAWDGPRLRDCLAAADRRRAWQAIETQPLALHTAGGETLAAGWVCRAVAAPASSAISD